VRHHRPDAYSAEQVLMNKRQIYGGAPKLHWYQKLDQWSERQGKIAVSGTARKMSVDTDATPDLSLFTQQKLRIVQYRYASLPPPPRLKNGSRAPAFQATTQPQNRTSGHSDSRPSPTFRAFRAVKPFSRHKKRLLQRSCYLLRQSFSVTQQQSRFR